MAETASDRRGAFTPVPGSGEYPRLLGGRSCLDFANTVEVVAGGARLEFLLGFADLPRWGRHARLLSPTDEAAVLTKGEADPDGARRAFAHALALREAIRGAFAAVADGRAPDPADLAAIGERFAAGLGTARLIPAGDGIDWRWPDGDGSPERVNWEVARSALELLRDADPARLRRCDGMDGGCGWLFLDESRNRSRRWCSMEGCGSQAKMRRYRARGRERADGVSA